MFLKGNTLIGAKVTVGYETIVFIPSKRHDIVLAILPFLLILTWGISVALCSIIPIVGEAPRGLVAGQASGITIFLNRITNSIGLKILYSIVMTLAAFFICWIIAIIIVFVFFI